MTVPPVYLHPDASPARPTALSIALNLLRIGALTIDDEGRIWRVAERRRAGALAPVPARRAENPSGKGYLRVTVGVSATKTHSVQAHILIWIWFNGPIPRGLEVNHVDLDKQNNRLSNLELLTPSDNMLHAYAHGRRRAFDLTRTWRGRPVLTDEQKREMVRLRQEHMTFKDIGVRFGCSAAYAHRIIGSSDNA